MIKLRNLEISKESKSLLSVNQLDIAPGERLAIYGHGGSGKSLLLHFLLGNHAPELDCSYQVYDNTFNKVAHFDFNGNWTNSVINLLSRPVDLCLIDEPENCLSIERFRIYCDYMRDSKSTMVFVTHHLQYVQECSDKVLILKSGESKGSYGRNDFFNNDDPYVRYVSTMGC